MTNKVYVFDSHPVQYKAPVYQTMAEIDPNLFEVIYATDASVRQGHVDRGFGLEVTWDTPLLTGYRFRVLNNERGDNIIHSHQSLTGRGIFKLLLTERPKAVLMTQAYYPFDRAVYLSALLLRIPILIRQETQDEMFASSRGTLKGIVRHIAYRLMYAPVKHAFSFGVLNREHLLRHGVAPSRLSTAHFSVPDPLNGLSIIKKMALRLEKRRALGIKEDAYVVAFFGKLIPKKNPDLIFESLKHLSRDTLKKIHLLIVGAGELESELRKKSEFSESEFGIKTTFAGFVNQRSLAPYYLASDTVTLPSRKMGEAWGLVINEAIAAGCSVIMSDAVGCSHEFGTWERARIIPEGSAEGLANAITEFVDLPHDFEWGRTKISAYSTEAAAKEIVRVFKTFCR